MHGDPETLRARDFPQMSAADTEEFRNYIDGEWIRGAPNKTFDNINPDDTRDIVGRFQASCAADARAAVEAMAAAFAGWGRTPISRRAKILQSAAHHRTTTGNLVNAPFGGLKQSSTSTSREPGRAGLEFYTQIRTVYQGC